MYFLYFCVLWCRGKFALEEKESKKKKEEEHWGCTINLECGKVIDWKTTGKAREMGHKGLRTPPPPPIRDTSLVIGHQILDGWMGGQRFNSGKDKPKKKRFEKKKKNFRKLYLLPLHYLSSSSHFLFSSISLYFFFFVCPFGSSVPPPRFSSLSAFFYFLNLLSLSFRAHLISSCPSVINRVFCCAPIPVARVPVWIL